MKIAVYGIAKNEEQFVRRFMDAAKEADDVYILDTGSTDNTAGALTAWASLSGRASFNPFRFDDARNAALALVPADVDVCVSLDMDEVIRPGWRDKIEQEFGQPTVGALNVQMHTSQGDLLVSRVHRRHGWRWKFPCHEGLYPVFDYPVGYTVVEPDVHIDHLPDENKSRGDYLKLLAWGQFENPNEPRMLFYYARELYFWGYYKEAAERFSTYLDMDSPEYEAVEAANYLAICKEKAA